MTAARLRLLAWLTTLTAVVWALVIAGRGPLAGPPAWSAPQLAAWVTLVGPATAAVAALRAITLALAAYLWGATLLAFAAALHGHRGWSRFTRYLTVPAARRLAEGAVAGAVVAAATTAGGTPTWEGTAFASEQPPVMRLLDDGDAPPSTRTDSAAPTTPPVSPTDGDPSPAEHETATPPDWLVQPGDHLWSIAERSLQAHLPRPPSDAEIDPYWRQLIETNRSRLVDPADPDLVLPGQRLVLPPVS